MEPSDAAPSPDLRRRTVARLIVGMAVLVVLVFGALQALEAVDREDTPERYAELATLLAPPMLPEGAIADQPSLAEQTVALRKYETRLGQSARQCRELAQFAQAQLDALESLRDLQKTQPAIENLVAALAHTALGVWTHSDDLTREGGTNAIDRLADAAGFLRRLKEVQVLSQANAIEFVQTAGPRFGGPMAAKSFIGLAFSPEAGFLSFRTTKMDTVTISNDAGVELHDILVLVRLKGKSGETFTNVHFIPSWPAGAKRVAMYESGPFGRTVSDPICVTARIWAREGSSPACTITPGVFGW